MHHPAQLADVELPIDRLPSLHHLRQTGQILYRVLIAPPRLAHQSLRLAPHRTAIERRRPFPDRARLHHIVAEELKLISQAFFQLGQSRIILVLQKIRLQAHDGPPLPVEFQPCVVHAVLIQVRQDLVRMQRSRRRKQHLVQICRQPDTGRVPHGFERAPFLVFESLHPPHQKQSRSRRPTARKPDRPNCPIGGDIDLLDIGMHRRRNVRGIEKRLAQTVRHSRTRKPFVQQHRTIGNRRVQLRQRRMTMLRPLVGMPAAHRSDPGPLGCVFAPRRQRLLDFVNRSRVFKDRVIARTVPQAHDVYMRLHQPRHNRATAQID